MSFRPLLAAALLTCAFALTACGGGEASTATTSATALAEGASPDQTASQHDRSGSGEAGPAPDKPGSPSAEPPANPAPARIAPLRLSGGGSAPARVRGGGDNSVQDYGSEGTEVELRATAEAVHDFYAARVGGEWSRACSHLSAASIESLTQLAASSPQLKGAGCPAILAATTKSVSPELQRQLTTVDAISLRRDSERAFLIYYGAGGIVYAMPLVPEGNSYKLGALSAAALPGAPPR